MSKPILPSDILLDDPRFVTLGFESFGDGAISAAERIRMSVETAVGMLRDDPSLGAAFLARTAGNGSVLWTGQLAGEAVDGRFVGVKVNRRSGSDTYDGDNLFGVFLGHVRDAYRRYLAESPSLVEEPVREGQVITDFTRKGAYQSDIEEREESGEEFIHVDRYRPARFRFDAGRDGTTGHASRRSDSEVSFQKFECPFGTSYPAQLIVGSAAEASMLYERALRGELDWKATLTDLSERGLLGKVTERQKESLAQEYRAQFAWMREVISTDPSLKDRAIVAPSMLVPDSSFGRSQYDPEVAPSPAHVLARYINNPVLLYAPSQNGVSRALASKGKREPERFRVEGTEGGLFRILVVGSDTIGGREPGRKATSKSVTERTRDGSGNVIMTRTKKVELPFKQQKDIEQDYAAFAERMDSILAGVPEGMKVELVTGSVSTMGDSVGVGTPRMVERYVKERAGAVKTWNFYRHAAEAPKDAPGDAALSAVLMEHFAECYPVLLGGDRQVSIRIDGRGGEDEYVTFREEDGLKGDSVACFSVSEDSNNRNVLSFGSAAVTAGLPVVHVQENRTESQQRGALSSGAVLSEAALSGDVEVTEPLFTGEERASWDIGASNNLSFIDAASGIAVPFVTNMYPSPVAVGGISFGSAYGAFVALAAVEYGDAGLGRLNEIRNAENSTDQLTALYRSLVAAHGELSPDRQEKCMRQAVRLMAGANGAFAQRLLDLDGRDVVMPSTSGDTSLFVDLSGNGLNRFGRVLGAERDRLRSLREARIREEQESYRALIEEANRRQALSAGTRAVGEKVSGGLPANAAEAADAVWFLGTNTPDQLVLKDDLHSFETWDDENGADPLVREKASRPWVDDGEGGRIDNDFVFLFASSLDRVTGRRRPSFKSDSRDLTGVTRVDPKTGEEFVCAYGVPVRFNDQGNEFFNDEGFPCSYRLDNDAGRFVDSVVLADASARAQAIRHGMSLCLLGRTRSDGTVYYPLGQVFMEKSYDRKEKKWALNPHRSSLNEETVNRYVRLLDRGRSYPLNCIVLPSPAYQAEDLESVAEDRRRRSAEARAEGIVSPKKYISAEGKFLAEFNLALRMANATAVALGVPLRFPLDGNGRLDLGPGVPDELRDLAEKRVDSFIGVVREQDILDGPLPCLERIPMYVAAGHAPQMSKAEDVWLRPNDLVYAFGQYDFSLILAGQFAPLHEMAFRMEGGAVFTLIDSKTTRGVDGTELNKYLSYARNDERRFIVRSTEPEKVPQFLAAVRGYVERAKQVKVEARLVGENEPSVRESGLEGFVNLLSSNSDEFATSEHDIGREMTVFNASGTALQSKEYKTDGNGRIIGSRIVDGGRSERDVDGNKVEEGYWGKVEAKDGFRGYAQLRYALPDGTRSEWQTVTDLELAKDIVMKMVNRVYRMDTRVVPSDRVMEMLLVAEAVRLSGERFRSMDFVQKKTAVVDDKVVAIGRGAPEADVPAAQPEEKPALSGDGNGKMYVSYYGSRSIPEDAFTVQISTSRPKGFDVDVEFESVYPDYRTMVGPHRDGKIDDAGYSDLYRRNVLERNREKILAGVGRIREMAGGRDVYFLCYEKPGDFCHRYLLNNFLVENGIDCQENPSDRVRYRTGHVPLLNDGERPSPGDGELPLSFDGEAPGTEREGSIVFTESAGGYQQRTRENAQADDIDFTIAFAVNFDTYGEKATKKFSESWYIGVDMPESGGKGLDLSAKAVRNAAESIISRLPEEFVGGEPFGVNLAGNGLYTLAEHGVTQEQCDEFVTRVFAALRERGLAVRSLRSGGQTGVDESAAAVGEVLGIPVTVHAPKGYLFRGADGKDRSGEEAFRQRFASKDYSSLKAKVSRGSEKAAGVKKTQVDL